MVGMWYIIISFRNEAVALRQVNDSAGRVTRLGETAKWYAVEVKPNPITTNAQEREKEREENEHERTQRTDHGRSDTGNGKGRYSLAQTLGWW